MAGSACHAVGRAIGIAAPRPARGIGPACSRTLKALTIVATTCLRHGDDL